MPFQLKFDNLSKNKNNYIAGRKKMLANVSDFWKKAGDF